MIKPQLFISMKNYTKEQFIKDLVAGIIVAVIALPLSIALALASGVKPEQGLYTAIIAGFVIAFLGGSRVQVSGPTAAFATIVAGIVAKNGMEGLIVATILAGIILILMGILKLGNLIKYIPHTLTTGFTSGIAITILIGQLKSFLGLTFEKEPIETVEKVEQILRSIGTTNIQALAIGILSLAILIIWPKLNKSIPPSLIAVIVGSILVKVRMGSVPAMDSTGLRALLRVYHICKTNHITLILSHVQIQTMSVMKKAKFDQTIGIENFCANIEEALQRAEELSKE